MSGEDPPSRYHSSIATQHFGALLGSSYQAATLLAFMWQCAGDPWQDEPKVFLSASRLSWISDNRSVRARAVARLVKIGAIKKASKPTRSGTAYILLRPKIYELSAQLQDELANMAPRDSRYNKAAPVATVGAVAKSKKRKAKRPGTPRLHRRESTAYLDAMSLKWNDVGRCIEVLCGKPRNSVRYGKGAKDVEALAAWFVQHNIKRREVKALVSIMKRCKDGPSGNALRYIFEADTDEKAKHLQRVLKLLRPVVDQPVEGAVP